MKPKYSSPRRAPRVQKRREHLRQSSRLAAAQRELPSVSPQSSSRPPSGPNPARRSASVVDPHISAKTKIGMPVCHAWRGEPYSKPLVKYTRALPIGRRSTAGVQLRVLSRRPLSMPSHRRVQFSQPEGALSLADTRPRTSPRVQAQRQRRQIRPVTPRPPRGKPGPTVRRRSSQGSLSDLQLAGGGIEDGVSLFRAVRNQQLLTSSSESSPSPLSSPSSPQLRIRRTPPAYLTRRYVTQMKLYQALRNDRKVSNQVVSDGNLTKVSCSGQVRSSPSAVEGSSHCTLYQISKRRRSPPSGRDSLPPSQFPRKSRRSRRWSVCPQLESSSSDSARSDSSMLLSPAFAQSSPPVDPHSAPCSSTPYHISMASQSFSSTPSSAPTTPLYPHSFTSSTPGTPLCSQVLPSSPPTTPQSTPLFTCSAPNSPLRPTGEHVTSPSGPVSHSKDRMLANKEEDQRSHSAKDRDSSTTARHSESHSTSRNHSGQTAKNPYPHLSNTSVERPTGDGGEMTRYRQTKELPPTKPSLKTSGTSLPTNVPAKFVGVHCEPQASGRGSLLDCDLSPPFFSSHLQEAPPSPRGCARRDRKESPFRASTVSTSGSPKITSPQKTETVEKHPPKRTSVSAPATPVSRKYSSVHTCLFKKPPPPRGFGSSKTPSAASRGTPSPPGPTAPSMVPGQNTPFSSGHTTTKGSVSTKCGPKPEEDLLALRDTERRCFPPASGLPSHIPVRTKHSTPTCQPQAHAREASEPSVGKGPVSPFKHPSASPNTSSGRPRRERQLTARNSEGRTRHYYHKPDTPRPKSFPTMSKPSPRSPSPTCGKMAARNTTSAAVSNVDPHVTLETRREPRSHSSNGTPGSSASQPRLQRRRFGSAGPERTVSSAPLHKQSERPSPLKVKTERGPQEGLGDDEKDKTSKGQGPFKVAFPCAPIPKPPVSPRTSPHAVSFQSFPLGAKTPLQLFKKTAATNPPVTQPRLEESGDPQPPMVPSCPTPLHTPGQVLPRQSSSHPSPELIQAFVTAIGFFLGVPPSSIPHLYPAPAVQESPANPSPSSEPNHTILTTAPGPARSLSGPGPSQLTSRAAGMRQSQTREGSTTPLKKDLDR